MDHYLPSLLEWGPWLWRGLTVAFVLLVLVVVVLLRYARARVAGKQAGQAIRTDRGAVRGVLRGSSTPLVSTITVEAYNISSSQPTRGTANSRADKVWLETADKKIELVGPLAVTSGARFTSRRGDLPRLSKEQLAATHAQLPWSTKALHSSLVESLADGDEVAVVGLPQPHAGTGETTAREADIAWTLASTDDKPLQLVAIKPAAPRLPFGIVRSVFVMGAAWGVAAFAFHRAGKHYDEQCYALRDPAPKDRTLDAPLELGNDHPCVIAASIDNDRPRALELIHDMLERHPYRDAQVARALVELDYTTHGCRNYSQLFHDGRYEDALEQARLCRDPRTVHESLAALGRFEEAMAVEVADSDYERTLPTLSTLIATKRWTEAAARVEHNAEGLEPEHVPYQRCVAELLRYRGGDAGALARLQKLAAEGEAAISPDVYPDTTASACTGVLAQIDPAARKRWLAKQHDTGTRATRTLRSAAGGQFDRESYDPFESVLLSPEASEGAWVWLAIEATDDAGKAFQLRQQAARAVYDDDHVAAKRYAVEAVAATKRVDEAKLAARTKADAASGFDRSWSYRPARPDLMVEAVALYTDEVRPFEPARRREESRVMLRNGSVGQRSGDSRAERVEQAFAPAKETGNGQHLLGQLRPLGTFWYDADLLAVLPHIKTHRASIARELPYWPPQRGDDLFDGAQRAMIRRELFERLGTPAEATRWQQTYRRFAEVLEDRDRLIALILIGG